MSITESAPKILHLFMLDRDTTTIFDHPHRPPLDPDRVARALAYTVERIGHGEYRVRGSSEDYFVTLLPYYDCPCGDAVFRETICKHQIAVLLFERDREAVCIATSLHRDPDAATSESQKTKSLLQETAKTTPSNTSCAAQGRKLVLTHWNDGEGEEDVVLQPPERVVVSRWW